MRLLFPTHAAVAPAINFALRFSRGRLCLIPLHRMSARVWCVNPIDDRESINKILDEGFVCHVGFAIECQPFVIPTMYARVGDAIYFHGSAASRMLRGASAGIAVCVTVTLVDGLVLARSVFNHSMNYRSVVALGKAALVDAPAEKIEALRAFTEKILPGRWNDARQPNEKELKATSILRLPLTEVDGAGGR
jgi:uncharacterized protein